MSNVVRLLDPTAVKPDLRSSTDFVVGTIVEFVPEHELASFSESPYRIVVRNGVVDLNNGDLKSHANISNCVYKLVTQSIVIDPKIRK